MQMSADIPYSFTGRFQKNSLCIPVAETSTSHSVRCYTTLWNVTHIFRVLHLPAGQGPSTSSTGSRRRRKSIPHFLWSSNSRSISKAHRLCGGEFCKTAFKRIRYQGRGINSCGSAYECKTVLISEWLTLQSGNSARLHCSWRKPFQTHFYH